MKNQVLFSLLFLFHFTTFAQVTSQIKGKVFDENSNEAIAFATVIIEGTTLGTNTDESGNYIFNNIKPGFYTLAASYLGYEKKIVFEIQVVSARPTLLNIGLKTSQTSLNEVKIVASPFTRKDESPVSLNTLGVAEIQRNPGGNRDISKAIQSLPGVASGLAFRNDIIIRGGAPNENRFYLDGMEVPNINHFATQGSSGGPVGMINVDMVREVDFYSGAFPANRGNTLSSILEFKYKDAPTDKTNFRGILGSSDVGLIAEGPLSKKTTYLVSARRSYLQFLFSALGLPFLPTYNDFQGKVKYKINEKNELSYLVLGALDDFSLNLKANETEAQRYLLSQLPVYKQWNYANGLVYKNYRKNGYHTVVLSRNMLNNAAFKYIDNDETKTRKFDYLSQEIENKFRYENNIRTSKDLNINYGTNLEYAKYNNSTFQQIIIQDSVVTIDYNSKLDMVKWGFFGNISRKFWSNRLVTSLGLRADANNYSPEMSNLLDQLSPRLSLSYQFFPQWSFNFNVGRYFQLPAYTVLGYQDNLGNFVNKVNKVTYIKCDHLVTGFEYFTNKNFRAKLEGFYKNYSNYPFLINEQVALANLGSDFGVIGNAPVTSTANGRCYGLEVMLQQKMVKGFYGIASFTYVISQFEDFNNQLIASAWDNRTLVSLTAGKIFEKGWEIGSRFRHLGGAPYTPYDQNLSTLTYAYDASNQGYLDYSKLNSLRYEANNVLDLRIDKKWPFAKWTLDLYLDVQNVLNYELNLLPSLTPATDENGDRIITIDNAGLPRYTLNELPNTAGQRLTSIGIVVDF